MLRSNDPRPGTSTSSALSQGYRTSYSGELIRPDGSRVTELGGARYGSSMGRVVRLPKK